MARYGLSLSLCAGVLLGAFSLSSVRSAPPVEDRNSSMLATLAVQTAMQQAREAMLQHQARAAVEILEAQIARINGNQTYLALLRDAYRACIRELRVSGQEPAAQLYLRRLQILEPGAAVENPTPASAGVPSAAPGIFGIANLAGQKILGLGKQADDDDPFRQPVQSARKSVHELRAHAERKFQEKRFCEAGTLFAEAHAAESPLPPENREQWAYCKLHRVVEQLNRSPARSAYPELEAEVRQAMELAPRLEHAYARNLLGEIDKRKRKERFQDAGDDEQPPQVSVRHLEQRVNGWAVAESANFRVYYHQAPQLAEQAAQIAEITRWRMQKKWFGAAGATWEPKCDIVLHATAQEYSAATHVPPTSPGHSSFNAPCGPGLHRRLDLHCDNPNMLHYVLPHETTHAVLVGNFGNDFVPRWADEGMAVLAEPADKIEAHLRNLVSLHQQGRLFPVQQLIQMRDYPTPDQTTGFYAQGVSLVAFLVREKGAQTFASFLREGMAGNYEAALQKHYGYRGFSDLEVRWTRFAFQEAIPTGNTAAKR